MDTSTEKTDTANIGSLFQQIINDLKVSEFFYKQNCRDFYNSRLTHDSYDKKK